MEFEELVETAGKAVDLAGVLTIVFGGVLTTVLFARRALRREDFTAAYRSYRQSLGRAILLGLEFLVAGDIIRTVAVSPTFTSVGVLAAIVVVRTFLSFSLSVELEGRWPWQQRTQEEPTPPPAAAEPATR